MTPEEAMIISKLANIEQMLMQIKEIISPKAKAIDPGKSAYDITIASSSEPPGQKL